MSRELKLNFFLGVALLILSGCGAPTGTGRDDSPPPSRTLKIQSVLAVDDVIVGGRIVLGQSLDPQTGKIVQPIKAGETLTGSDGKTTPFDVIAGVEAGTLFFQVYGGTEGIGGDPLSEETFFTGLIEVPAGRDLLSIPRVNITPLSTLIAHAKSRSPETPTTNLISSALNQFLVGSTESTFDLNSQSFQGQSSETFEVPGDGAVLQLLNEMIKSAARVIPGSSSAERVSRFLRPTTAPPSEGLFFQGDPIFEGLSRISSQLATNSDVLGGFFSEALTSLATAQTLSFRPTRFISKPLESDIILVGSRLQVDGTTVVIRNVLGSTAYLGPVTGAGAVILEQTPDRVRIDLTDNSFESILESSFYLKVEKSVDNLLEAEIEPVVLQTAPPAQIIFPEGAEMTGKRISPGGSTVSITVKNQSEDRFASQTSFLDVDLKALRSKAEEASGGTIPSLEGDNFAVEIRFGGGILFQSPNFSSTFSGFILSSATIIGP